MSRAQRRSTRPSARSRRVPTAPTGGSRFQVPWVPIVVLIAIVGVAALVVYLIAASDDPPGNEFGAAARAEGNSNPDLPGEFIDLQRIYGGVYGEPGGSTTASHVQVDEDYATHCVSASAPTATPETTSEGTAAPSATSAATATASAAPVAGAATPTPEPQICNSNPPAGGPHWAGGCADNPEDSSAFCGPPKWGVYREPWEPESLVHAMEHGGVVIWYNTSDQEAIDELEDMALDRVDKKDIIIMSPYPDMEDEAIAVTSWSRIDKFPISEYTRERVDNFIDVHLCRFNPEDLSGC